MDLGRNRAYVKRFRRDGASRRDICRTGGTVVAVAPALCTRMQRETGGQAP
jgi:hypothetical protein